MSESQPQPITPAEEIQNVTPAAPAPTGAQPAPPAPQPSATVEQPGASPAQSGPEAASPPPPPPPPEAPAEIPPAPAPAPVAPQPKVMPPEWPCAGYTGPQPWEADNPPTLTQNHLMVSSGSAGPDVVELAALLAHLGYASSISGGKNPHAIYDTGVSDAVRTFCRDYNVEEDPAVRQARTQDTVGPWIWEALTRAVHKQLAGA